MKQYLDLLKKILSTGVEKESGRKNMPNTVGLSNAVMQFNLNEGFPLLTTKKIYWRGVIHELLWFLRGDTNIKYLVDNNVNIWSSDAYRWYLKLHADNNTAVEYETLEQFIAAIKMDQHKPNWFRYTLGDLGKVYGYQWRNQNGVDQIYDLIEGLKTNPYSRYHIVDSWNKSDFESMALPPCHLLYQFIVRPLSEKERLRHVPSEVCVNGNIEHIFDVYNPSKFYLDINVYQRSCDMFLGVPFNIASMALFATLIAKTVNMIPGVFTWIGGDVHIYKNHLDQVKIQLQREPYTLPTLRIDKKINSLTDIETLSIKDFVLVNYTSHPELKAPLSVGL